MHRIKLTRRLATDLFYNYIYLKRAAWCVGDYIRQVGLKLLIRIKAHKRKQHHSDKSAVGISIFLEVVESGCD